MTTETQLKDEDRREGKPAVPSDYKNYLNPDQLRTYVCMLGFGWKMYFIRRPLFQHPTTVMINSEGTNVAVIEESGNFDQDTRIALRN